MFYILTIRFNSQITFIYNNKIRAIMKTLKDLKNKCNLIAEFKNSNFIGKTTNDCYSYVRANKCALYTNNKGKFYFYKCIQEQTIQEYDNYEEAIKRFNKFVNLMLER